MSFAAVRACVYVCVSVPECVFGVVRVYVFGVCVVWCVWCVCVCVCGVVCVVCVVRVCVLWHRLVFIKSFSYGYMNIFKFGIQVLHI